MSDQCVVCGKSFSGFMSAKRVGQRTRDDFAQYGEDVSNTCEKCCHTLKTKLEEDVAKRKRQLEKRIEELKWNVLNAVSVSTTPHDHKWDANIKGVVTGYSVVGTGPLAEIASAWTDFFGTESNVYLKKIREGENKALTMAKYEAALQGANHISGATLTVSEATKGNGMLIIFVVGTAVQMGEVLENAKELSDSFSEYEKLNKLSMITILGGV